MKPFLSHDGHVEVVNQGQLQSFAPLVVVRVVEGLNVEKHRVPVIFASLCSLYKQVMVIYIHSLVSYLIQNLLLQFLAGLDVERVVQGLNVEKHRVPVTFASLRSLYK